MEKPVLCLAHKERGVAGGEALAIGFKHMAPDRKAQHAALSRAGRLAKKVNRPSDLQVLQAVHRRDDLSTLYGSLMSGCVLAVLIISGLSLEQTTWEGGGGVKLGAPFC